MIPGLQDALSRLAALFEYGELQAETLPVEFVGRVADEVEQLRAERDQARADLRVAIEERETWREKWHVLAREFDIAAKGCGAIEAERDRLRAEMDAIERLKVRDP